jgi:hypothetical protein
MRASQLTGHRVRALAAGILNNTEVAIIAIAALKTLCYSQDAKEKIPVDFHIRNRGLYETLIVRDTCRFAAPAPHAERRLGDDHAQGIGHKNLPWCFAGSASSTSSAPQNTKRGYTQSEGTRTYQKLSSGNMFADKRCHLVS